MKQDFIFSLVIHIIAIVIMLFSAPFQPRVRTDLGEVIKVNLAAMPSGAAAEKPMPKVDIPSPIVSETPVAPITEVASVQKPAIVQKPKPKPKPKKKEDDKYKPQAEKGDSAREGMEGGKKDITEALGSGSVFGKAAIDEGSFEYPYWFTLAFSKIERNWSNPVYASNPMNCTIYFQVIKSGRIIKVEIEKSSGIEAFDRACERAVNLSQPLPPLPDQFTQEIIGIHLEFPYVPKL